MKIDMKALIQEVQINNERLKSCKLHLFSPDEYKPGKRMTCLHCSGKMQTIRIADYIRGYEARGGDCDDIWPGYRNKKAAR